MFDKDNTIPMLRVSFDDMKITLKIATLSLEHLCKASTTNLEQHPWKIASISVYGASMGFWDTTTSHGRLYPGRTMLTKCIASTTNTKETMENRYLSRIQVPLHRRPTICIGSNYNSENKSKSTTPLKWKTMTLTQNGKVKTWKRKISEKKQREIWHELQFKEFQRIQENIQSKRKD